MAKTETISLGVNPIVKQRAENVLSRLEIPMSTAINIDMLSVEEIHVELQKGYDDIKTGRVQDAASAFVKFRENH